MKKIIFFYIIFNFFSPSHAEEKAQIIKNLSKIDNLSFNFTQTINGKDESGECIIEYPKKIYCKYNVRFNKILVSNGKSIVIKSEKNNQYYRYPLKTTPLLYLLDKKFILKKIKGLEILSLDDKYLYFSIDQDGQIINLFFNKKNFDLIGWQTEDIFQNLTVTRIYNLKKNNILDEKIFILPNTN